MKSRGVFAVAWLSLAATLWVTPVDVYSLDVEQEREDSRVKALFITHLFSFISWPDGHQAERICATQTSTLSEVLEEVLATKPGLKVTPQALCRVRIGQRWQPVTYGSLRTWTI